MDADKPTRRLAYGHHLAALLAYLALTLLMTYPLAREFLRAIPGDGFDGWQNVWNLWWVKRALLVEGSSPYFTRWVDYPDGVYLYFHTLNIFNGLTFLPFTLWGGPLLAYNVAVLFSFVAGGYGTYLLALYVLRRAAYLHGGWPCRAHLAAFVGGAVFTFAPYHMAHLLGHLQLISLEWLPFYALFAIKLIDRAAMRQGAQPPARRPGLLRYVLLSVLFLALVAACDWYYAFYMALFTGLYLAWSISRRRVWRRPVLAATVAGGLFLLVSAPLLVPMLRETLRADYMVPPVGSTERLSADLTAFFTPSELHPWWGEWASRWAERFTASLSERSVFAGYTVLALALVALLGGWSLAGFWIGSALDFAMLAMGPVLHVGGATTFARVGPIPLPYTLLPLALPFLKISRSVSRFDVVVMLSLGVLAAIGLNWLLNRIHQAGYNESVQRLVALGALGLVGLEFWVAPYPMSVPETQPFHYQMAQETEPFAVMDIPMDWDRPANLLYQTVHQKPLVSGYTSRANPLSPAWRTPVLQAFRYLGPDINSGDTQALATTVLNDLGVRYVVVHKSDLPPGDYRESTLTLADATFAGWPVVVDDAWLKVFRVLPADVRLPYLTLGEGWAPREWKNGGPARGLAGPTAELLAHLPAPYRARLELSAVSLDGPAWLEISHAGQMVGRYPVGGQETSWSAPWLALPAGTSLLQVRAEPPSARLVITRAGLVAEP